MDFQYDFSQTGLPPKPTWQVAAEICFDWLNKNMPFFAKNGGTANFMLSQPVAAARRLLDTVPNCSEELVTLALLGPAKDSLISSQAGFGFVQQVFGERAAMLLLTTVDMSHAVDAEMLADAKRLFLAESVSMMNDQMVGRQNKDAHHQTRWQILGNLEATFVTVKGENPKLDAIFEDVMRQSKDALTALDNRPPRPPKPRQP